MGVKSVTKFAINCNNCDCGYHPSELSLVPQWFDTKDDALYGIAEHGNGWWSIDEDHHYCTNCYDECSVCQEVNPQNELDYELKCHKCGGFEDEVEVI